MQMSEYEIVNKYNRNDDKKAFIKILAQLNGCSEDDIKAILIKNGVKLDEADKKPKRGNKSGGKVAVVVKEESEVKKPAAQSEPEAKTEESIEMPKYKTVAELMEEPNLTERESKRLERALAIPMPVRQACADRMEVLTAKIMELEKERDEICDFLNGEVTNG